MKLGRRNQGHAIFNHLVQSVLKKIVQLYDTLHAFKVEDKVNPTNSPVSKRLLNVNTRQFLLRWVGSPESA